jgi:5-methylcytosine-specific restriction endonuclease McrA
MPIKDVEKRRQAARERYQRKSEEIKEYQRDYRKKNKERITKSRRAYQRSVYLKQRVVRRLAFIYRAGGRCVVCGESDPSVLQFHHRDQADKKFELGRALNAGATLKYPIEVMLEELAKCDLLCANCHTRRHNTWTKEEFATMEQLAQKYFPEYYPDKILDVEKVTKGPKLSVTRNGATSSR